jgi:cell division septation protein DedD
MSPKIEDDSEILLGNKQLLLVFGVVAVLLAVAFTGGYMVGKNNGGEKKPAAASTADSSGAIDAGGPATHTVPALGTTPDASERPASGTVAVVPPAETSPEPEPLPLGSKKSKAPPVVVAEKPAPPVPSSSFTPEHGQTFLQVAAVGKDEADAVADVLRKKGFRAHSVPKPDSKLYRVLIGPLRDAGDLANTREELRKTGFREVIKQPY